MKFLQEGQSEAMGPSALTPRDCVNLSPGNPARFRAHAGRAGPL